MSGAKFAEQYLKKGSNLIIPSIRRPWNIDPIKREKLLVLNTLTIIDWDVVELSRNLSYYYFPSVRRLNLLYTREKEVDLLESAFLQSFISNNDPHRVRLGTYKNTYMYHNWDELRDNIGYFAYKELITAGSNPEYKMRCEEYFTKDDAIGDKCNILG